LNGRIEIDLFTNRRTTNPAEPAQARARPAANPAKRKRAR
jgi:hypothetical protein